MQSRELSYFPLMCGPEFLPSQACEKQRLLSGIEDLKEYANERSWIWNLNIERYFAKPGIAIIVTDITEQIVWINKGFSRMTGYHLPEISGRRPSELLQGKGTSNETKKRLRSQINRKIDCSDKILNYRKNGEAYWCKLDIWPLYNKREELVNFIAFEREIWDQKIKLASTVLAS